MIKVLIDSGAEHNYIRQDTVTKLRLKKEKLKIRLLERLRLEDGSQTFLIQHQVRIPNLEIGEHREELIAVVLEKAACALYLGLPWFRRHNSEIDWQKEIIEFRRCDCIKPVQQLSQLIVKD